MTIYLYASTPKSQWRTGVEDTFKTLVWQIESEHGQSDPSLLSSKLDLNLAGAAVRDITGWGSLPYGVHIKKRDLIDLWQEIKDATYNPARPYPEWVWASAHGFLGVVGREGRGVRLVV